TLRLAARGRITPDAEYFADLVAKAIMFRRAERLVGSQNFGGYRANIVTYSLALLAHLSAHRIDLEAIWARQDISEALADVIVEISYDVHRVLVNPPGGGNVTEWAKKEACWERMHSLSVSPSSDLESEFIPLGKARKAKPVSGIDAPDELERAVVA